MTVEGKTLEEILKEIESYKPNIIMRLWYILCRRYNDVDRVCRIIYDKTFHKYTRYELWNLDYTIAEFIYPRLVAFKKMKRWGYCDTDGMSPEEWEAILDKMIIGFESYIAMEKTGGDTIEHSLVLESQYIEGFTLFAKYYRALWD